MTSGESGFGPVADHVDREVTSLLGEARGDRRTLVRRAGDAEGVFLRLRDAIEAGRRQLGANATAVADGGRSAVKLREPSLGIATDPATTQPRLTTTDFTSVYSAMPSRPPSRPRPDSLKPPNGIS